MRAQQQFTLQRQFSSPHAPRTLAPLLRERWATLWRGSGFGRTRLVRRATATLLIGLAAVLALAPPPGAVQVPVVVAARDLSPGTVLGAAELVVTGLPAQLRPDGAVQAPAAALGRILAAPVRRGEPLTDVRLAGPELVRAVSADPAAVSVPLRLLDPDIAALLHPGAVVDVVTLGERQDQPVVLASAARVLTVLPASARRATTEGRLVLLAIDAAGATRVAGASLSQALTVTLR